MACLDPGCVVVDDDWVLDQPAAAQCIGRQYEMVDRGGRVNVGELSDGNPILVGGGGGSGAEVMWVNET